MIQQLKRKAPSIFGGDHDTEALEYFPSVKRQRITISAMQNLFAKFSISDEPPPKKDPKTCPNKFWLIDPRSSITPDDNAAQNNNHKSKDISRCKEGADEDSEISKRSEEEKVRREEETHTTVSSEENASPIKRQAECAGDEGDGATTDMPQTKKVRHLKRGLRLCSSITCYIEQVVY